ncbi:hypothetical protein L1887_27596 [Cichorium endivia]|nr:hypothetical protein L1887_27596 [Cichorium endivia]
MFQPLGFTVRGSKGFEGHNVEFTPLDFSPHTQIHLSLSHLSLIPKFALRTIKFEPAISHIQESVFCLHLFQKFNDLRFSFIISER